MNYNDSGVECSFLQNLVTNIYTPSIRVLKDDSDAVEGEIYIKKNKLYRKDTSELITLSSYVPGDKYSGITVNHVARSNAYTSDLHEALGNYLRMLRDCKDVDLMPLYNCFSNRFEDDFTLPISIVGDISLRSSILTSPPRAHTRLIALPVKFNKQYSIYCKKPVRAKIQVALYDKKELLTYDSEDRIDFSNGYQKYLQEHYASVSLNNRTPAVVNTDMLKTLSQTGEEVPCIHFENRLFLFIEIPADASEFVIIFETIPQKGIPNTNVLSNSTLLQNINSPSKPYSDKLPGYLLDYFISPLTSIPENIDRIQRNLANLKDSDLLY